ncbi:nucleotide exchange factor GrpE [Singulisphaera sp. Ch08]|uniref:Protein GrpE n=1 Tax=Singulisphaera sp. Ch08 TaxID=3120278 RepID=A0AAU7CE10_9BACT
MTDRTMSAPATEDQSPPSGAEKTIGGAPQAQKASDATAGGEQAVGGETQARTASAARPADPETLRAQVAAAEQQRDDYLAQLQRIQADAENFRKRLLRDQAEQQRYAPAPLLGALLPVLDNLERALEAARQQSEEGPLVQGVALVRSQLLDILGRFGLTPIGALDQPFDPDVHEAVQQQPRADATAGHVVEVLQPGYSMHDRVVRPAKVVVASSPTL